jgi:aspartyl-tRNA(Asn)/glutamyl-tRNA(Gln) amidotransferase subunit B
MPAERRRALLARLSEPTPAQVDVIEVVVDLDLDAYVLAALDAGLDGALALARAANELAGDIEHLTNLTFDAFVATLTMESSGALSATQAKSVLAALLAHGGDPAAVATAKGFQQLSSDSLEATVAALIEENPDEWARYRDGDEKLAQFFIGQVMKLTKGQANGKSVIAELQSRR